MPQQRMDIRMIKDILRLKYSAALSHEAIARSLGISKGVVAKYLGLAGAAGLDWATVAELDEAGLERRLLGRRGGWAGLGDVRRRRAMAGQAGDKAFSQLGGTLQGAAGVGAGVLEGGKGDHEGEDAPSWIAGSDGDGGSCCNVVVLICRVHVFLFVSGSSPFHHKARRLRAASGSGLQRAPLVPAPAPKPRGEGQR